MVRQRVAIALAIGGMTTWGCQIVTHQDRPITTMIYEAEYGVLGELAAHPDGATRTDVPAADRDRAGIQLAFRSEYGETLCLSDPFLQVRRADGGEFVSAVFLGRGGLLLVQDGFKYYRVGTFTRSEGPGPVLPTDSLKVKWDGNAFRGVSNAGHQMCLFTYSLPSRPRVEDASALLAPGCDLQADRREPAAIYHVETTASPLPANQPFSLTAYVDGKTHSYALTRIPVAETFKAEVDPAAHTITVTGEASYPEASPEKGCAVPGGIGNYHTPVTVPVVVTAPAGTYKVRIPDTHFRAGLSPSQQNYLNRESRQEMTITVE